MWKLWWAFSFEKFHNPHGKPYFCEREFISSNYFLIVIIRKSILICLCVRWVNTQITKRFPSTSWFPIVILHLTHTYTSFHLTSIYCTSARARARVYKYFNCCSKEILQTSNARVIVNRVWCTAQPTNTLMCNQLQLINRMTHLERVTGF